MEPTDWHEIEKHSFVQRVAVALERLVRERGTPGLVIAAPPSALADLRKALHPDVKTKVLLEITKDLTNHPVWEIERNIIASLDEV